MREPMAEPELMRDAVPVPEPIEPGVPELPDDDLDPRDTRDLDTRDDGFELDG